MEHRISIKISTVENKIKLQQKQQNNNETVCIEICRDLQHCRPM